MYVYHMKTAALMIHIKCFFDKHPYYFVKYLIL